MSRTAKLIKKGNVGKFLENISEEYYVFVPAYKNNIVSFQKFAKESFKLIEYSNFYLPPAKCFFFPSIWTKFIPQDFNTTEIQTEENALFGVRPCDALSLTLLDRALKDNELYKDRRNKALIIVIGCNSPQSSCFCTLVKGGPFSIEGADIFMSDVGNDFIVEDISGKGTKYLAGLSNAKLDDLDNREDIAKKSFEIMRRDLNLKGLPEKLERMDKIPEKEALWEKLSEGCSNCGLCTSVCPTCHCCFVLDDITDMVVEEAGEELTREWDPCMFNIFVSAGLSGPAPQGYQRLQRRMMDKFCHSAKTLGQPFCVGCGRCTVGCKEKLSLKKTLKSLTEL